MKLNKIIHLFLATTGSFLCSSVFCAAEPLTNGLTPPKKSVENWISKQPVLFTENMGQLSDEAGNAVPFVLFKASAGGTDIYITEKGITYVLMKSTKEEHLVGVRDEEEEKKILKCERIDMELQVASIKKENILKEMPSSFHQNFFFSHCSESLYKVKSYGRITIRDIYPGIDWVLYNSSANGFKYDFIVHPGADASVLKLLYISRLAPHLDQDGSFVLENGIGFLKESKPISYVKEDGRELGSDFHMDKPVKINGRYETTVTFNIHDNGTPTQNQTLVIDPQLTWATFFGGFQSEGIEGVETDKAGNVFTGGYGGSALFPLMDAGTFFQSTPIMTACIMKFTNTGQLLWSTLFGQTAEIKSIACDNAGNLFIVGVVSGTFLPLMNAGGYFDNALTGNNDMFLSKFDNAGNLLWCTFYGGSAVEFPESIDIDINGNIFVTGYTASNDFPVLNSGTYFLSTSTMIAGFIVKFSNTSTLLWGTYFEYSRCKAIKTDLSGKVYVTGWAPLSMQQVNPGGGAWMQTAYGGGPGDILLAKFDNLGNLLWRTYYGGTGDEQGECLATDAAGNVFVVGLTRSFDLPLMNAGTYFQSTLVSPNYDYDLFILKFNSQGVRQWATFFGGPYVEMLADHDHLDLDSCGNLYVSCTTESTLMPVKAPCDGGFYDSVIAPGSVPSHRSDQFIARFTNNGVQTWGTYLGGDGGEYRSPIDLDKKGNLFMSGEWISGKVPLSYPITNPGGNAFVDSTANNSDDIFVVRFGKTIHTQTFAFGSGQFCQGDTAWFPTKSQSFINGGIYTAAPGLSIHPTSGQIFPTGSSPGVYSINYSTVVSDATCRCQASYTISAGTTVTITPTPTLSVSGPTVICRYNSATLIASGASSYSWSSGSQSSISVVSPTLQTTYTLTGSTAGCVSTTTVFLRVFLCEGVAENENDGSGFFVFPNPSEGEFVIKAKREMRILLTDETGKVLRNIEVSATQQEEVRITQLSKGVYFLYEQGHSDRGVKRVVVK